ncbi:uncharacterized protein [Triticum aestivum]|uniref:uncharacterized protein n=1 Tax=Triticum aestivum TaxID=4565 RepID=UPI0008430169|nr:uncharacterized protein LOC123138120 [Triticum aestivum]
MENQNHTVAMDAKLMVSTHGGHVNMLKDVLNKEDAMATMLPSEDQSGAAAINPLLLLSARRGSWEALNALLQREDARDPPMMIPTLEFLELVAGGSGAQGRSAASAGRDVEEGVDQQPAASPAAGALLKGVTADGDTALHAVAGNGDCQNFLKYAGIVYDRDRALLFVQNHKGDTPLHCAARAGNSKMVSRLIDLAACEGDGRKLELLRMENKRQETALHEAVRFEDGGILGHKERLLLDAADPTGEEKNKRGKAETEGALNEDGKSPVAAPEEQAIVKLLMGADRELANYPAGGISPLYLAVLLEKGTIALTLHAMSGGNLSYSGADGQNALHLSILRDTVSLQIKNLLKLIWKQKTIIPRVKTFAWRLLREALPTAFRCKKIPGLTQGMVATSIGVYLCLPQDPTEINVQIQASSADTDSPLKAEALALLLAAQVANRLNISQPTFLTDCLSLASFAASSKASDVAIPWAIRKILAEFFFFSLCDCGNVSPRWRRQVRVK